MSNTLLRGDLEVTIVDGLLQVLRVLTLDGAAQRHAGTEHLLDGSLELLGLGLLTHLASDGEQLVLGQVTAVADVLGLLAVTWGLLKGLDNEGSSSGKNNKSETTTKTARANGAI